ncbi:MAG TPA: metallophosphoesterase family protein [Candidatus Limnocylindria bacterium]|nr:metallophosphoesterase family protein [Candidatus Limnocylindria bacterium]
MTRIALLSDVHGNLGALEAVRKAIKKEKPDVTLIAGDLVMNGPEPGATLDALREMERDGAIIVQGNTDIAVADADYAAAFPHYLESGVPDAVRVSAEWTHDALDDDQLAWLRRLPAERRVWIGDDLILVTHASPGSQTQGFDKGLDPSTVYERISRTDARVICCGHTHIPDIQEFGWKVIVNGGSAGYSFDGDPTASWALVTLGAATPAIANDDAEAEDDDDDDDGARTTVTTEIRRTEYDVLATANAISARGLPGDVYRAATVRTGKLVR